MRGRRRLSSSIEHPGLRPGARDTEGARSSGSDCELKFIGDRSRPEPALGWLRLACRPDPAFRESTICTAYYDTPDLDCLREKCNRYGSDDLLVTIA